MGLISNKVLALGSFTAAVTGTAIDLDDEHILVNGKQIFFRGFGVGTVIIEVSPDDGTTWIAAKDPNGVAISATADAVFILAGNATQVRADCTAWTSGTLVVEILIA